MVHEASIYENQLPCHVSVVSMHLNKLKIFYSEKHDDDVRDAIRMYAYDKALNADELI